jgi:hypothetical protein
MRLTMNRRALLAGLGSSGVSAVAHAAGGVIGMTPLGPMKRAFVNQPQRVTQQCSEWCWAASSSMVFDMHGHPIDQKVIVQKAFGGLACMAGPSITIAQVLSASWTYASGNGFQSQLTAAYDFANGINAINNQFIVSELLADRPLLYGNAHHAMVVCQVDYVDTPMGPNIQQVYVLDPWPWSPSFHPLTQPEMVPAHMGGQMNFLAAVTVS